MFKNAEKDAGIIGLVIVLVGMVGSVFCGFILDKTRLFKYVWILFHLTLECKID